ncbi:MAG: UDP-N-acetylmuramoyl-L-alanyl-D-glutamate--2,6-diaminopimelate ligase [Planctomycetota bacterium]|nr:UDP-N-acetylmuramoyl-L-alanyl-D-glutamate--2,6-diaminopimelate ligase [Planctomycetota bacterium]
MRLRELIFNLSPAEVVVSGDGDPEISAVVCDSRRASPGCLFAALPGAKSDGTLYIADARRRGAVALLLPRGAAPPPGMPCIIAAEARKTLAEIAEIFYGRPSRRLRLVGVTGTNGKSTTAFLIAHLARCLGKRAGLLGTIRYEIGDRLLPAPLTTPESVEFSAYLAAMAESGVEVAAAEVSSHALVQHRVWPHRFACAVFTNLTRDHLDYHRDMDSYLRAKKILFDNLDAEAVAAVNIHSPASGRMVADTRARVIRYGMEETAEVFGRILASDLRGTTLEVRCGGGVRRVFSPLVGTYNALNVLAALAAIHGLGLDVAAAAEAVASFGGVPGRLERIVGPNGVTAFVDYAHTDDALRAVLSVLRPLTPARLIAVFGCGGDRDRGKRPLMARAAEENADIVIITSDNPRTEDPQAIIRDIVAGLRRPGEAHIIVERRAAVQEAVRLAREGDVILLAGKGHEDYQIIGTTKYPMDDRQLLRDAFAALGAGGKNLCA